VGKSVDPTNYSTQCLVIFRLLPLTWSTSLLSVGNILLSQSNWILMQDCMNNMAERTDKKGLICCWFEMNPLL